MSEEAAPFLNFAVDLMRRFMPTADQRTLTMAAIWLVGQCTVFVRNREQLANPPVSLNLDDAAVERLVTLVSAWSLAGLADAKFQDDARPTLMPAEVGAFGAATAPIAGALRDRPYMSSQHRRLT